MVPDRDQSLRSTSAVTSSSQSAASEAGSRKAPGKLPPRRRNAKPFIRLPAMQADCPQLLASSRIDDAPALLRWRPFRQLLGLQAEELVSRKMVSSKDGSWFSRALESPDACSPVDWEGLAEGAELVSSLCVKASGRRDVFESKPSSARALYVVSQSVRELATRLRSLRTASEAYRYVWKKQATEYAVADERFGSALRDLARDSEVVQPGECLLAPFGWCDGRGRGHASVLVLCRGSGHSKVAGGNAEVFIAVAVNRGHDADGGCFHPAIVNAREGSTMRRRAAVVLSVPRHKLSHAATWFVLLRPLVLPPPTHEKEEHDARRRGFEAARDWYETCLAFLAPASGALEQRPRPDDDFDVSAAKGCNRRSAVLEAVKYAVRCSVEPAEARRCVAAIELCALDALADQLDDAPSVNLDEADMRLARAAARRVAASAVAVDDSALAAATKRAANRIEAGLRIRCKANSGSSRTRFDDIAAVADATSFAETRLALAAQAARRSASADDLAGPLRVEPLALPVDLARVRFPLQDQGLTDLSAAINALRRADRACVGLENMPLRRTAARRFALVSSLFLRQLPCPRPPTDYNKCIWRSDVRRESQREALALLRRLALHLAAAAAQMPSTRELDGERSLVLAAVAVSADAVARAVAVDEVSPLSLFYSGAAAKGAGDALGIFSSHAEQPFGFDMRYFAADTSRSLLPDPALVAARSALLDYFRDARRMVPARNLLFRYETRCGPGRGSGRPPWVALSLGDARLLDRLCVALGYPVLDNGADLADYLVGAKPGLLDDLPELAHLRDIVATLKTAIAPIARAVDKDTNLGLVSARPTWRIAEPDGGDERARAQARRAKFPLRLADAVGVKLHVSAFDQDIDFSAGQASRSEVGDASDVFEDLDNEAEVDDDLLLGRNATVAERLLAKLRAALTPNAKPRAPPSGADPSYLAGELVTSEEDVLHLPSLPGDLGAIQHVDHEARLSGEPPPNWSLPPRDVERLLCYLTAPYLRLPLVLRFFTESGKLRALRDVRLRHALDSVLFEPGPWLPSDSLKATAVSVVPATERHHLRTPAGALANELALAPRPTLEAVHRLLDLALDTDVGRYAPATGPVVLFAIRVAARVQAFASAVANATFDTTQSLSAARAAVRGFADTPPASKLICAQAAKSLAALLIGRAATALRRWLDRASSIDARSQIHAHLGYLYARLACADRNELDSAPAASAILTAQCYLSANAAPNLEVTELELCSLWQLRRPWLLDFLRSNKAKANVVLEDAVRAATTDDNNTVNLPVTTRDWVESNAYPGRFAPVGDDLRNAQQADEDDDDRDYEAWLRNRLSRTLRSEIIDVQLGEFVLRRSRLEPLPIEIRSHRDLGDLGIDADVLAVELAQHQFRTSYRLLSARVDVAVWQPPHGSSSPFNLSELRQFVNLQMPKEAWIKKRLDDIATTDATLLYLPKMSCASQDMCVVAGYRNYNDTTEHEPTSRRRKASDAKRRAWREWHVHKNGLVEVYDVVDHSRRWLRMLASTTDPRQSLGRVVPSEPPPGVTLEISRVARRQTGTTRQTFVPRRFLSGALPDALLDQYDFWQNDDNLALVGLQRRRNAQRGTRRIAPIAVVVDGDGHRVRRVSLAGCKETRSSGNAAQSGAATDQSESPLTETGSSSSKRGYLSELVAASIELSARISGHANTTRQVKEDNVADVVALPEDMASLYSVNSDEAILELVCLRHKVAASLAARLVRLVCLADALIWAHCGSVALVEFSRLGLTFHGPQLQCREHVGFRLAHDEELRFLGDVNELDELLDALPSALVVCDETDASRIKVLLPAENSEASYAYDVDRVSAALVPPNVAAAAHLAQLFYKARRWAACAGLAEACVSDEPRLPAVSAALESLAAAPAAPDPDAIACRLRLMLACANTGCEGGFTSESLPWSLAAELAAYVAHRSAVSAELRLSADQERRVLAARQLVPNFPPDAIDAPLRREIHNRAVALGCSTNQLSTPPTFNLAKLAARDKAELRRYCVLTSDKFDAGKNLAYVRPVGFEALLDDAPPDAEPRSLGLNGAHAIKWLRETLNSAALSPTSIFCRNCIAIYELLTGTLPLRVGDRDGPFGWGAALLHIIERTTAVAGAHAAGNASTEEVLLASVLHILSVRGGVTHRLLQGGLLARYKPPPKPRTLAEKMLASEQKRLHTLFSTATKALKAAKQRGEVAIPNELAARRNHKDVAVASPPDLVPLDEDNLIFLAATNLDRSPRAIPRVSDGVTQRRWSFSPKDAANAYSATSTKAVMQAGSLPSSRGHLDEIVQLLGHVKENSAVESVLDDSLLRPLGGLAERFAPMSRDAGGGGRTVSSEPPFEVKWGTVGGEPTASSHERRLRRAATEYAALVAAQMTPKLLGASFEDNGVGSSKKYFANAASALSQLYAELDRRNAADTKAAKLARIALANIGAIGDDLNALNKSLKRIAGLEPRRGLHAHLDASAREEAEDKPGGEDLGARSLACAVALLEGRAAHARRCMGRCDALAKRVAAAAAHQVSSSPSVVAELRLEAEALAEALWEKRHHFTRIHLDYQYDARLLLVEQAFGVLLRPQQVEVALNLAQRISDKESRITQMIMGAGKTTVLLPTLVYLLARADRLVCAVVPTSLVVFTRDALRHRIARPSLGFRPVWRLVFGRRSLMSASLLQKLEACAARGGVVLADPTSVKALFLKSIEVLHGLDESLRSADDAVAESEALQKRTARKSTFASFFGSKKSAERERRAADALGVHQQRTSEPIVDNRGLREEADVARRAMGLLKNGVAILDEVDVVLHPLRSELNWPLGSKAPLDFTIEASGLRWRIPHLLIDAVVSALGSRRKRSQPRLATVRQDDEMLRLPSSLDDAEKGLGDLDHDVDEDYDDACGSGPDDDDDLFKGGNGTHHNYDGDDEGVTLRREMRLARAAIDEVVRQGLNDGALARSPHLILLSPQFYDAKLRPALTTWVVRLLRSSTRWATEFAGSAVAGDLGGIDDETLRAYLGARADAGTRVNQLCSDDQAKLLNIYQAWLTRILPFVLSRVDRVHYGMLSPDDVARAVQRFREREAKASRIAAVPLARRLLAVPFISKDVPSEASEFSHPDVLIGLSILAVTHEGLRPEDVRRLVRDLKRAFDAEEPDEPIAERRPSYRRFERYVLDAGGVMRGSVASKEAQVTHKEEEEVWPLPLIDTSDSGIMAQVCSVLRNSRLAARDYLWRLAFPATLSLRPSKLHASGQELGGDAIFGARLGFSGTPNDLVPAELCVDYDAGTDGKIACVLADTSVVALEVVESGWTPKSLLQRVATEPFDALIDCGALITHMTNLEVGAYVAEHLSPHTTFEGVLCFDQEDQQFLIKAGGAAATAEVSPESRITFYDHAHCTGVDIKQKVDATACVTLSKDTTYRDFAQAAFRLRGLGRGQAIVVLLIPELVPLIVEATRETWQVAQTSQADICVRDVLSWLVTNEIRKERPNFYLLAEQNVANVVRKVAHVRLMRDVDVVGSSTADRDRVEALRTCLDVFRTRVDYTVENAVPVQQPASERVAKLIEEYAELMTSAPDFSTAQQSLQRVSQAEDAARRSARRGTDGAEAREESSFAGQQEQEAEEEAQQEEEQEHHQHVIQHQMAVVEQEERKYDEPETQRYSRQDEGAKPWSLDLLLSAPQLQPTQTSPLHPFYALQEFQVYKSGSLSVLASATATGASAAAERAPRVGFPSELRLSPGYHSANWRTIAPRRIKNVSVILEYTPSSVADDGSVDDDVADANYDSLMRSRKGVAELRADAAAEAAAAERLGRAYDTYAAATATADESRARSTQQLAFAPGQLVPQNVGLVDSETTHVSSTLRELDQQRGRQLLRAANLRGSGGTENDALSSNLGTPAEALASSFTRRALRPRASPTTYVVLSLAEAEHLRGVLHMSIRSGGEPDPRLERVALRLLGSWDPSVSCNKPWKVSRDEHISDGVGVVLDAMPRRIEPSLERDLKVMACLQFFDVADEVSPRHAALLLRALQCTPVAERIRFRDDVSRCRRRPRVALFSTAGWLGSIFSLASRRVAPPTHRVESHGDLVDTSSGQAEAQDSDAGGDDDAIVTAAAAETRDAALAAINRRRTLEAGRASASKAAMRFAHAALVLSDETAIVEWRAALLAIRRALKRRRAPTTALLRRTVRASLAAADQAKAKGLAFPCADALFPVGVVACALRWLDLDFDRSRTRRPDSHITVARALDLNGDGWIAFDELRSGLHDAKAYELKDAAIDDAEEAFYAPFLPLPRIRPVITEIAAPAVDDAALAGTLAGIAKRRRHLIADNLQDAPESSREDAVSAASGASRRAAKAAKELHANVAGASPAPSGVMVSSAEGADEAVDSTVSKAASELTLDDLRGLTVRLRPPSSLEPVWSSLGTASGSQVSVWRPDATKMTYRTALRLCVGHYAARGVDDPLTYREGDGQSFENLASAAGDDPAASRVLCLELCDTFTFRRNRGRLLAAVAERLCPPPLRFRQIWHLPQGERSVYGWAPVPRSDRFVALGHVATRHPEPPDPRCVRTVPAAWCVKADALALFGQQPVWTNSSLGGRKGSLWKQIDTSLLFVCRGHTFQSDGHVFALAAPQINVHDHPELLQTLDDAPPALPPQPAAPRKASAQPQRSPNVADVEPLKAPSPPLVQTTADPLDIFASTPHAQMPTSTSPSDDDLFALVAAAPMPQPHQLRPTQPPGPDLLTFGTSEGMDDDPFAGLSAATTSTHVNTLIQHSRKPTRGGK